MSDKIERFFRILDIFGQKVLQKQKKYGRIYDDAPVAQQDRAQASDAWCRRFESGSVYQRTTKAA